MAFHAKIDELTKTEQVALATTVDKVLLNKDRFGIADWRKSNVVPMVHSDDKDWWWYMKHNGNKVCCLRHRSEDHGKPFDQYKKE